MSDSNVFSVSNWFIAKAKAASVTLGPLKFYALLYFAQGWYAAVAGRQLFPEGFDAYDSGVANRAVYRMLKSYGKGDKPLRVPFVLSSTKEPVPVPVDEAVVSLLEKVWLTYGAWTTGQLVHALKQRGTPWHAVANQPDYRPSMAISWSAIRDHFSEKAKANS